MAYSSGIGKDNLSFFLNTRCAEQKIREGQEQFHALNYEAALNSFTAAISLEPNNVLGFVRRAECSLKMMNYYDALQDCSLVTEFGQCNKLAKIMIECHIALGDFDQVKKILSELNESSSSSGENSADFRSKINKMIKLDSEMTEAFESGDYEIACKFVTSFFYVRKI